MTAGADHEVTTYVENRAECYSACALIFLAGQLNDRGGESYPARFLHVGGRLGFHAPYIDPSTLEDRAYSRTEVADSFKVAISGVTAAIKLFDVRTFGGPKLHDDNRPWVSSSLFIEMLRKGANELFSIDTIGKAGRWGIQLIGVKEVGILNTNAFRQACDNVSAWENDTEGSASPVYEPVPSSETDFKYFIPFPELIESKYYGIEAPSAGVNCIRELGCDSLGPSDLIRTNRWSNAPKSRFGV